MGVRMAMLGCDLIGLDEPAQMPQIKKIIVYVEMDRCATDAISYVTGVKLGRRSLKFIDNGIIRWYYHGQGSYGYPGIH